jgi:leucyl/phenylalanyl-tRNA---protein transferase
LRPVVVPWLKAGDPFPPVERALTDPNGLLAAGGALSVDRLVDAYSHGIFPWFSDDDPVLWWSPDPRMVLFVDEFKVSRSLRRTLKSRAFTVTADTVFAEVMRGCAAPRDEDAGTWITAEMFDAYGALARAGIAHSIEVWSEGALVGGLYGVAIGRMFFGESMFSRRSDASKVALAALVRQLRRWEFELVDCQMETSHLASLGARVVGRAAFLMDVRRLVRAPGVDAPWRLDPDLLEGA